MEKEKIDPIYKYVDDKLKLIKGELQQLKVAHDAVAAEQKKALLKTQQDLAHFVLLFTTQNTKNTIYRNIPHVSDTVITQLVADASAANAKVDNSSTPLVIAIDFQNKCEHLMDELGIELLNIR